MPQDAHVEKELAQIKKKDMPAKGLPIGDIEEDASPDPDNHDSSIDAICAGCGIPVPKGVGQKDDDGNRYCSMICAMGNR